MQVRDATRRRHASDPVDLCPSRPARTWHVRDRTAGRDRNATLGSTQITAAGFPYLVAVEAGRGHRLCLRQPLSARERRTDSPSRTRSTSHRWRPAAAIGKVLLDALIARCSAVGLRQMLAVIGDSDNTGSIGVHRACGFDHVGTMKAVGRKFDRWVDVVIMQRALATDLDSIATNRRLAPRRRERASAPRPPIRRCAVQRRACQCLAELGAQERRGRVAADAEVVVLDQLAHHRGILVRHLRCQVEVS